MECHCDNILVIVKHHQTNRSTLVEEINAESSTIRDEKINGIEFNLNNTFHHMKTQGSCLYIYSHWKARQSNNLKNKFKGVLLSCRLNLSWFKFEHVPLMVYSHTISNAGTQIGSPMEILLHTTNELYMSRSLLSAIEGLTSSPVYSITCSKLIFYQPFQV